jgi:hypothetical protein
MKLLLVDAHGLRAGLQVPWRDSRGEGEGDLAVMVASPSANSRSGALPTRRVRIQRILPEMPYRRRSRPP